MTTAAELDPAFLQFHYTLRRSLFTMFGAEFRVLGPEGQLWLYARQKAFRLREKFIMYADEQKSRPLLQIETQQVLDFGSTYMVTDLTTNETIGGLRRKGFKSMIRDEWAIVDPQQQEVGKLQEDSNALLRRVIPLANLVPQTYHVEYQGQNLATFKQRFNPFVYKLEMDFRQDPESRLDPRLSLAAGVLLAAIEGRQQ